LPGFLALSGEGQRGSAESSERLFSEDFGPFTVPLRGYGLVSGSGQSAGIAEHPTRFVRGTELRWWWPLRKAAPGRRWNADRGLNHKDPGAAPITLRRYTHVLAGELDRAREQLDEFLAEREAEEAGRSKMPPNTA
jgi:hypothetical protein